MLADVDFDELWDLGPFHKVSNKKSNEFECNFIYLGHLSLFFFYLLVWFETGTTNLRDMRYPVKSIKYSPGRNFG